MSEFLDRLSGGEIIGLAAVIVGPLIAIVAIVMANWRRVRVAEIDAALKQQMLDKGMSAAEIEQVLQASVDSRKKRPADVQDRTALVQEMIENGYEGADIERVLKAYQEPPKPAEKPVAAQP
jgi:hypothetical protein